MNALRTPILIALVFVAGVLASGPAQAEEVCIPIKAKGEGYFTGPTSTASRLIGGGNLQGTTTADLEITGVVGPGVVSYDGTLVLTTKQGTLTLSIINGVYDTTTGEFSNDSVVTAGTGRFAGASGGLYFHGFVFPDGTFFDDEISGQICVEVP